MKGTILLNYNENTKQVEEEEKTKFLKFLLEQVGVSVEEFWTTEGVLSVDQRMKLRSILESFDIKVFDDLDGHMQVYAGNELIGEWHKCIYKLKRDLRQMDPRKQLYLEMIIDCWSLFDESE